MHERVFFFFSSRRRHTRSDRDWSSDVCSSDLEQRLKLGVPFALLDQIFQLQVRSGFKVARHLDRQDASWAQHLQERRKERLVRGDPLEGGVGKDEIGRPRWMPGIYVGLL